jgi:hypothetical protein
MVGEAGGLDAAGKVMEGLGEEVDNLPHRDFDYWEK